MRLKDGFITHEGAEEHITVPAGGLSFSGMIRSNQTAGFIVECLKDEVTAEQIVEKMLEKYDAPKERITRDVEDVLAKLRGIGALEELSCTGDIGKIWKKLHLNRNWREKVRSPILVVVSACFRCFGSRRIFLRSQRGRADAGNMMWHCINGRMERMCFIVLLKCCRMGMYFLETTV